jgi:hypothetical protein
MARLTICAMIVTLVNAEMINLKREQRQFGPYRKIYPTYTYCGDMSTATLALSLRGGAEKVLLTTNRSAIGTLVLMFRAFFQSLVDPTFMMEPSLRVSETDEVETTSSSGDK